MKPTTTSGFIAVSMENPALEIENFERLVEQYRARVLRFVFASVRDMDIAETLTQDCFLKAYRSRSAFRGACSIHTWLIRIAINLIVRNRGGPRPQSHIPTPTTLLLVLLKFRYRASAQSGKNFE